MSDIFAAMVDHEAGETEKHIWQIGEDVYAAEGSAIRSMRRPAGFYCYREEICRDYYPDRYTDSGKQHHIVSILACYSSYLTPNYWTKANNGGVHINSGIANLAFYLLVKGGSHPRAETTINVEGIGYQAAAEIVCSCIAFCSQLLLLEVSHL